MKPLTASACKGFIDTAARPVAQRRSTKMFARLRCGGYLPLCLAFGTGEGHLWYGICVPCSKRLPGVRDASSEAFGVKNRLFRY